MVNLYHILYKKPYLDDKDMPTKLEFLAKKLINSGLLRIDAGDKINFARLSLPTISYHRMFSLRELTDKKLLPATKIIITKYLNKKFSNTQLPVEVNKTIKKLKQEIFKYISIDLNLELKLARIVTQMTDSVIIELCIYEKIQIFISYSQNIGSVLDIQSWQKHGQNSGMQTIEQNKSAIYITFGDDPFGENKYYNNKNQRKKTSSDDIEYGPGFASLARGMAIGGQEFGHFADIIRNNKGQYVDRHSTNISVSKAKPRIAKSRLNDLSNISKIEKNLNQLGLKQLYDLEKKIKFFNTNKIINFHYIIIKIKLFKIKFIFFNKIKNKFNMLLSIKKYEYPAIMLNKMIIDMKFNLAPKADVYEHNNKQIKEAIACVEALARVPQQCNKWGSNITKLMYKNLYKIYYNEVIPACIRDLQRIKNKTI